MGKALIIQGADFSVNALNDGVTWIYDGFSKNYQHATSSSPGGTSNGAWSNAEFNSAIQGKTINRVRGIPAAAGTYNFYKVSAIPSSITQLPAVAASIEILPSDIGLVTTYQLNAPISVGDSEYIVCGENGLPNIADFMFFTIASSGGVMWSKIGTENVRTTNTKYTWLDFGYEE